MGCSESRNSLQYGLEAGVKVKQIQCAIGSLYNIAYVRYEMYDSTHFCIDGR